MNNIKSFEDLIVWQKSMDVVQEIYIVTKKLPPEENYGLKNQMRRAAVSIPSNIAEGYSRGTKKEYVQFLHIAKGSKAELQTQLMICERLKYIDKTGAEKILSQLNDIGKMLYSMINKIQI